MEYSMQDYPGYRKSCSSKGKTPSYRFLYLSIIAAVLISLCHAFEDEPSNRVSIEDFIDLDGESSPFHAAASSGNTHDEVKVNVQGQGQVVPLSSWSNTLGTDVLFDDEDFLGLTSGSGSGSGDDDVNVMLHDVNGQFTPTQMTSTTTTSKSTEIPDSTEFDIKEDLGVLTNRHVDADHTFADADNDNNDDTFEEDADAIYDLPGSSPVTSNHIINPASWGQWSDWIVAGTAAKVRVRTCQVDGEEVNEVACEGVRVQMMSCENAIDGKCGKIQNISTVSGNGCGDAMRNIPQDKFLKAPPPPPPAPKAPPLVEEKPNPDICQYSLYDNYRQKYVFTRWNLTELITKSKVKRWCDKTSGQYLVMTTPQDHCRRYYKDLCKVSDRCHSDKPTKERGDFAEGCWRNLVYGEMLPIGLSNKQTIVYFICQRFAGQSKTGKMFGYKSTHFGTLYDTKMRSPVLSLSKITKLGDETWPETDYFIEHGLVESESDMLWLFRKPRKGMLTLRDLDRCHDDQGCDIGLRQILPQDYQDSRDTGYVPTHLMWPELMAPDPGPRLATFTMTNMAPLQRSLFQEWHDTIRRVRQYAIEQCGVPVILDSNYRHLGEFTSHRTNKSAMYLASGIIPSMDPVVMTGHDVHVPFLFWMSGCCVQHHTIYTSTSSNDVDNNNSNIYETYSDNNYFKNETWNVTVQESEKTNVTAFAVYIRNIVDSHVIPAPVLQLEMLLQDIYKTKPSDADVSLFPGHDSVCSDLKNDVSRWFQ